MASGVVWSGSEAARFKNRLASAWRRDVDDEAGTAPHAKQEVSLPVTNVPVGQRVATLVYLLRPRLRTPIADLHDHIHAGTVMHRTSHPTVPVCSTFDLVRTPRSSSGFYCLAGGPRCHPPSPFLGVTRRSVYTPTVDGPPGVGAGRGAWVCYARTPLPGYQ